MIAGEILDVSMVTTMTALTDTIQVSYLSVHGFAVNVHILHMQVFYKHTSMRVEQLLTNIHGAIAAIQLYY